MRKINKPVIGITTFCKKETHKSYDKVSCSYIKAISESGGLPLLIPLIDNLQDAKNYIDLIDALVLSGGKDIFPLFYGEKPIDLLTKANPRRDKWELELFNRAYELDLPILGICRGMQLINVALGGTLYQDIAYQYNNDLIHLAQDKDLDYVYHKVNIAENTILASILCSNHLSVNSYHHQAIKDLAPGLKISAVSEEGAVIEAIEDVDKEFIIGVQWHPEDLIELHPCFNELFGALVERARY
ncbi:gamma-glutamyl-gamma-aminobutyrate hydrolase family protein [Fuchsiella alkaliacetigena]|uniref:gamma-glutamyl-gamma-aminobutyrate hydrolase family protein n=1 Tax=Fuchsiella alkaliacetigena TaxID=957042 RepID=UPI00200B23E5|nr:gamma-glutamyl-gamma-aminobutyrate hydrolase family protein [Fuchsiella alkaliacetigena]MCK8824397.1 gamma-glutamyl-gamma-aminobutyrate hydrolase family protein [Fuchsiella alkaliacetigena]